MQIRLSLVGTSPLLMHNPKMVDPDYDIQRQIKAITGKRKKTDDDLKKIEELEWFGGLFLNDAGQIVQPTSKVRKCLINTGRIFKLGKQLERAVTFFDLEIPLQYEGPTTLAELFADKRYHSRLSVGVGGKRVMRVRPQFMPWSLSLRGIFIEDAGMNLEDLERIVDLAGQVEGIGDNRVNGFGHFEGKVHYE